MKKRISKRDTDLVEHPLANYSNDSSHPQRPREKLTITQAATHKSISTQSQNPTLPSQNRKRPRESISARPSQFQSKLETGNHRNLLEKIQYKSRLSSVTLNPTRT